MPKKVLFWSLIVSLGGFLFGFDTAVISGAEQAIQQNWNLSPVAHGFTISVALIGTIIGALTGGIPSQKWGRRNTLLVIAIVYFIASLGSALVHSLSLFILFRFVGGIAVGASSVTAPIYLSEISPAKSRGKMVAMFQFMVVTGMLVSYLSNYIIGSKLGYSWRVMLGVQAVPSLAFLLLLRFVPKSPRWLISFKGDKEEALAIMKQINPTDYEKEMAEMQSESSSEIASSIPLFQKKYRLPIFLAIAIAFFNQCTGINAILYFAPRIFEMAGLGTQSALLSSVGVGAVNSIFTLVAMALIDKMGRKKLMIIGSVGMAISLGIVSYLFFANSFAAQWLVVSMVLVYIAFFAVSQGAVIWVFISEIFPNAVRAKGQTVGSMTHWTMATLIAFFFPIVAEKIGGGATFAFFSIMMVLQFIFSWKIMPETSGKSLEELESILVQE